MKWCALTNIVQKTLSIGCNSYLSAEIKLCIESIRACTTANLHPDIEKVGQTVKKIKSYCKVFRNVLQ